MSKRDAVSFFDVLQAPAGTNCWFCCPPLRAGEIAAGLGVPLADLRRFMLDDAGLALTSRTRLHPASLTWPMGFSWSSAVAQDVTLGIVTRSGVSESCVLCDAEEEVPCDDTELATVATDDTIFFHRDPDIARARLASFDKALKDANVPRAVDKDIDLAASLTGLGCELASVPPAAGPARDKLRTVFLATLGLDASRRASPRALHGLLGVDQWFCLLSRPHFACFRETCNFVLREPSDVPVEVPRGVINELLVFCALAPLLTADLSREWLPLLTATDAAPEYGFGTSVCHLSTDEVAAIGRKAERRGEYVRLARAGGVSGEPEKTRLGQPHRLGLCKDDFRDVLSVKAARPEHAGVMELKGVLLSLRWLLRLSRRHGKRIVLLVDAKAALRAVAKGRTNAPAFHGPLRAINALLLATNSLLRPVYVPSEDNPADVPSRGRRRRPVDRRVLKKPGFSKIRRRLYHLSHEEALIEELLRINRPTPLTELTAAVARRLAGGSDQRTFYD